MPSAFSQSSNPNLSARSSGIFTDDGFRLVC